MSDRDQPVAGNLLDRQFSAATVNQRWVGDTMALRRRCPGKGLLHHSDQGSPYASEDYQLRLDAHGITCSMSRRANCYDNAVMESFFSIMKSELADRFDRCGDAKMALFDSIEVFYNQRRRHSTLGQISPAAFEHRAHDDGMDALENRQERGSHSAHTRPFSRRKKKEDQAQSTPTALCTRWQPDGRFALRPAVRSSMDDRGLQSNA
jgi:hypothetical protein